MNCGGTESSEMLMFFLSLNAFRTYNLLVQQHVLRCIWDVPQSWRWRGQRGWFVLIFFSFLDGIRTVIPSDYIFRLLECNQGCDLLKMILLIFIVLMRNGSLSHCSRDFNILNAFSALKKFGWKLSEWWKDHDKLKVVLSENFSSCSQYFQPAYMYMMPKSLEIFQE